MARTGCGAYHSSGADPRARERQRSDTQRICERQSGSIVQGQRRRRAGARRA